MPCVYTASVHSTFKARSKSSSTGSSSRANSMPANCTKSERSRSARRRKFSKSAWRRFKRSSSSIFSLAKRSRSADKAASCASTSALAAPSGGSSLSSSGIVFTSGSCFSFPTVSDYQMCLGGQAFKSPSDMEHGGHRLLIVHTHGAKDGNARGHAAGKREIHADEGQVLHRRMGILQTDVHAQFAGGAFEEVIQQLKQALLLLQSAKEIAHALTSEVEINTDQVGRALHMHLRGVIHFEQTFGVKNSQTPEGGVVGGALLIEAAQQVTARIA